jgi:RNA polymerase-binding protein DksA
MARAGKLDAGLDATAAAGSAHAPQRLEAAAGGRARRADRTADVATAAAGGAPKAARSSGSGRGASGAGKSEGTPPRTPAAKATGRAGGGARAGSGGGRSGGGASAGGKPTVPPGTDWTPAELAEVRADLVVQLADLRTQYEQALVDLNTLQQSANDGAGDDQADAGTKTFEREQELSIANNRLDLLAQMERAIERVDAATYGRCESCGNPIPKARLQAFPSATLCVACKQREERR